MNGKIYLIPTTLGESDPKKVLPSDIRGVLTSLQYFIVENLRSARRYLKLINKDIDIDKLTFYELNKHTDKNVISDYIQPICKGKDIGIISEAGNPGIADPGSEIVKLAHKQNINVVPLVGPSSILLALISSGMNGQNFAFNGYLPVKPNERIKKLKQLENRSKTEYQSQIFMEAPYRNQKLLVDILNNCNKNTRLCIAVDITLKDEFIKTKLISEWKRQIPNINKRPAIFIIQA
ncbi:MAG: SAM-dependent methyltransferase [bacterium]|nr:SAM-dependent methyltransferase [bacterium]